MPQGRTELYSIWRACERAGVAFPDVEPSWDANNVWMQAHLIAYDQIRRFEDAELQAALAGVKVM